MPVRKNKVFWGGLFVVFLGAFVIFLASLVQGPDREIVFVREVDSMADPALIAHALDSIPTWPQWYYSMADIKAVDLRGEDYPLSEQRVQVGETIKFTVEPKKQKWKRFELWTEVVDYHPGQMVHLRLLKDSSGRIFKLFDKLTWKVELLPSGHPPFKSLVRGTLYAHTAHWRSRLFTGLAERIVMNQLLYADLFHLSTIHEPPPNPSLQYEQ